jgi:hypothetical protein
VAAAGEDGASDAAAKRLEECELAFCKSEIDYVAAQRQVFYGVHMRAVGSEGVERFVKCAGVGGNGWGCDRLLRRGGWWRGTLSCIGRRLQRCFAAGGEADEIGAEQQENGQRKSQEAAHVIHCITLIAASKRRVVRTCYARNAVQPLRDSPKILAVIRTQSAPRVSATSLGSSGFSCVVHVGGCMFDPSQRKLPRREFAPKGLFAGTGCIT